MADPVPLATLAQPNPLAQQVAGFPAQAGSFLANVLGLTDAMRAWRGEMTPEEAQTFAVTGALGLIPGVEEAAPLLRGAEKLAPKLAEEAIPLASQGIRAFHGSPYDFDKFDLSKIGTGEGAQAYGHGLYFAEHPDTANAYRPFGEPLPENHWLNKVEPLLDRAEDFVAPARGKYFSDQLRDYLENRARPGKTYEVNIAADPEHFLDWDKPLSEQSPQVQQALKQFEPLRGSEDALYKQAISSGFTEAQARQYAKEQAYEPTGEHLIGQLGRNQIATEQLRQAGIPGIRYLDQGSRGFGTGTHNYVVFDDKLVDIIKKYGLAGLIAGGATHFSLPQANQSIPLSSLGQTQ